MKKGLIFIISLVLIFAISIPCFASSAEEQTTDKNNTKVEQPVDYKNLTIEDAYKLIEDGNNELKLMDDKIKLLEKQYNDTVDKGNWAKGASVGNDEDQMVELRKEALLYPKQDLLTLNSAKHDREELLKSLKSDVKSQILDILSLQQDMTNVQEQIASLDKTLEQTKTQIDLGTKSKLTLKPLESQKVTLQSQLTKTQRQINLNFSSLKKDLGIDSSKQITLALVNVEFVKFDDKDIEQKFKTAIENSYDVKKQQDDLELSKIEYDIIRNYTSVDNNLQQIQQLETTIQEKETSIVDLKSTIEADLWTKYYSLKNAEDDINIEKINLENAEHDLSITKAKVESGSLKASDEANAMQAVNQAKAKVQKTINTYMLSSEEMNNLIGVQDKQ